MNYTLDEWITCWTKAYKDGNVQDRTLIMYQDAQHRLRRYDIAAMPLSELSELELQRTLNQMCKEGYAKSTIEKEKSLLKQSIRAAQKQKLINENPAQELRTPTNAPVKLVRPLSIFEQRAVDAAAKLCDQGDPILFLLQTGLRQGELFALRWSDYDTTAEKIYIRKAKTKSGVRAVPLTHRANEIIKKQPRTSMFIFCNTKGDQLTKSSLRRTLERVQRRAGIDHLAAHQLRHTFITRLCEAGAPLKAIAQIVGHKDVQLVLRVYAEHEAKSLVQVIRLLEPRDEQNTKKQPQNEAVV